MIDLFKKCPICDRELGDINVDEHHLIPKTFKGTNTITLHRICHTKLHSAITEREMQHYYNTVDRLLEHEEIQKFIQWVSKKPIEYYSKNDETHHRYGKRRK